MKHHRIWLLGTSGIALAAALTAMVSGEPASATSFTSPTANSDGYIDMAVLDALTGGPNILQALAEGHIVLLADSYALTGITDGKIYVKDVLTNKLGLDPIRTVKATELISAEQVDAITHAIVDALPATTPFLKATKASELAQPPFSLANMSSAFDLATARGMDDHLQRPPGQPSDKDYTYFAGAKGFLSGIAMRLRSAISNAMDNISPTFDYSPTPT